MNIIHSQNIVYNIREHSAVRSHVAYIMILCSLVYTSKKHWLVLEGKHTE